MKFRVNIKRYLLYLLRWQLSTPILAVALIWLSEVGKFTATLIANLIGGLIFFWVDMFIFTSARLGAEWEVLDHVECSECGKLARGYRLVRTRNYDRRCSQPQFRCERCSIEKTERLRRNGVIV